MNVSGELAGARHAFSGIEAVGFSDIEQLGNIRAFGFESGVDDAGLG